MKTPLIFLLACLLNAAAKASFASEFVVSQHEKVQRSDVIAVGRIVEVTLGDIRLVNQISSLKTQDTIIRFSVEKPILGEVQQEIIIQAHSVDYTEGSRLHFSTAGFSNIGVSEGKRFIAYLVEKDNIYFLTEESNQFFERIDDETHIVSDFGQTNLQVPLEIRLRELKSLAHEKLRIQMGQP